ncbi:MAG TPA: small ribosomal subunit Rsm22 family protein, partial [Terriglobales bacterium]
MQLPGTLARQIFELSESIPHRDLAVASQRLSHAYRSSGEAPQVKSEAEQLAYLLVRLPATYAAIHHVLTRSAEALGDWTPTTLLDLGSGPGTALWAAHSLYHSIQAADAVDRGTGLSELGRSLALELPFPVSWDLS